MAKKVQVYEFDGNVWEAEVGEEFRRLLVEYESDGDSDDLHREVLEPKGMWEYIGGYDDVEEEIREKARSSEENQYSVQYNADNFVPRFFQRTES